MVLTVDGAVVVVVVVVVVDVVAAVVVLVVVVDLSLIGGVCVIVVLEPVLARFCPLLAALFTVELRDVLRSNTGPVIN